MIRLWYATAPFVTSNGLVSVSAELKSAKKDSYFAATSFPFPIQRAFYFKPQGDIEMFDKKLMKTRYPDLQEAYHNAGQFYWGKADAFLQNLLIYFHHASAHLMPRYRVQDIDTEGDGETAELLFSAMQSRGL